MTYVDASVLVKFFSNIVANVIERCLTLIDRQQNVIVNRYVNKYVSHINQSILLSEYVLPL